jgi:SAM-dependent methyltransferase
VNGPDDRPEGFAPGNQFDKYRTGNPVYRSLMRGFLDAAAELVTTCSPNRVLEIGCGPGDLAGELFRGHVDYVGIDVSADDVARARAGLPER